MGYPVISGSTDQKGVQREVEVYDRGTYIETITKVTKPDGTVDIYIDKKAK